MRKRKNNKLILFIILGVIVLCGIGIGVYFVIDNNKKIPDKKENVNEKVKEEKKVTIIDVDSDTRPYAIMINCHMVHYLKQVLIKRIWYMNLWLKAVLPE